MQGHGTPKDPRTLEEIKYWTEFAISMGLDNESDAKRTLLLQPVLTMLWKQQDVQKLQTLMPKAWAFTLELDATTNVPYIMAHTTDAYPKVTSYNGIRIVQDVVALMVWRDS
jgi:hypothetical protein